MSDCTGRDNEIRPSAPAPLLGIAVAVVVGIMAGRLTAIPAAVFLFIVVAVVVGFGIVVLVRGRRPGRWLMIGLWVGFGCLAAVRYHFVYSSYPADHIVHYGRDDRQLVTIEGVIVTEPYIAKTTGPFAAYDYSHPPRTVFTLDSRAVETVVGMRETTGLVHVVVTQPAPHLRQGQAIRLHGWLSLRRGANNPGQYDGTDRYHATGKLCHVYVNTVEAVTVLSRPSNHSGVLGRLRRRLQAIAQAALIGDTHAESNDSSAFLGALLLGQRHNIKGSVAESFVRTGSIHFLSVSGLHVGFVAGFVWFLCRSFGLRRRLNGILVIAAIAVYVLIVPPRPPILRAAIICSSFALAYLTRRTGNSLNLISFAAVILLLMRPLDLFNAGFQLSFTVALAIVTFVPVAYNRERLLTSLNLSYSAITIAPVPGQRRRWWQVMVRYVGRYAWGLAVIAVVAWFAGLPLVAYHFHRISLWGPLSSVILYPLISLTMFLGLTKLIFAAIFPIAAAWLSFPLSFLAEAAISVTGSLARLPYASINTSAPPLFLIAVVYALLIGAAWFLRRGKSIPRLVGVGLIVWTVVFFALLPFKPDTHVKNGTTLHVLAVGHGCAAIIELPDGKTIAYDAGSRSNFGVAEYTILPFLRYQGIQRLDALFISHPDIDHYSGAVDLAGGFPVEAVYLCDPFAAGNAADRKLLAEFEAMGLAISHLNNNSAAPVVADEDGPSYEIQILWPPPVRLAEGLDDNNSSLVIRIKDEYGSILLTGDIGEIAQRALAQLPRERIESDVLVLPHHGSPTRVLPGFVAAVNPDIIINSCGRLRPTKVKQLVDLLGDRRILHTWEVGAVTAQLTAGGLVTETHVGR